jgi:hypothetical protein
MNIKKLLECNEGTTGPSEHVTEQVAEQVRRSSLCLQRQPLAVREIMQAL